MNNGRFGAPCQSLIFAPSLRRQDAKSRQRAADCLSHVEIKAQSYERYLCTEFVQVFFYGIQALEGGLKMARMVIERNITLFIYTDIPCANGLLSETSNTKTNPRIFTEAGVTRHFFIIYAAKYDELTLFREYEFVKL